MKKIDFIGKRNIDKFINKPAERNNIKDIDNKLLEYDEQIKYINKLFLEEDFIYKILLLHELKNKLTSYKNQDIEKNIYNENEIINISDIIEKLVISKLKCYYCKHNVFLLYKKVRECHQWTLDRINNNIGHTNKNTIIACLKCNLERRRIKQDAFLFTKQLKICKHN